MSRFACSSKNCDFSCVAKNRQPDYFSRCSRFFAVLCHVKKVLQRSCKTQLMERDALNQQHVTQCNAIAHIKYRRSLLVVGKSTG